MVSKATLASLREQVRGQVIHERDDRSEEARSRTSSPRASDDATPAVERESVLTVPPPKNHDMTGSDPALHPSGAGSIRLTRGPHHLQKLIQRQAVQHIARLQPRAARLVYTVPHQVKFIRSVRIGTDDDLGAQLFGMHEMRIPQIEPIGMRVEFNGHIEFDGCFEDRVDIELHRIPPIDQSTSGMREHMDVRMR